ncbi:MAG: DNA polymerase III, subunit gamma and tau [Desulfobulbaceae bacterium DB1]|nr:MAG: DNA polymerase III, subunit gamma and tau [Desulfobulbaceae bacterium DB1]
MSYLVLARKWRPQTFADVVGQEAVVRTLRNGLARNRVAHAMIFSGVRGVGKTTLARIMAKALNCLGDGGEKPCNQCRSCLEITAGSAVDLQEIDGASNRGIQEIRELKENIRFFPTQNRFKVVIIDEVHMLTTEAFNALLKTLEEPPEHVYFMFATTELHKVPITILSRCQRYELKRVPFGQLVSFFERISAREEVEIPRQALEMIAREADGSVRDGLSLLDQVFSFGGTTVTVDDVVQVLGLVDQRIFFGLAEAILSGNLAGCFDLLAKAYDAGLDLKRFASDLIAYMRALLICRTSPHPEVMLDVSDQELDELRELSARYGRETLSLVFQLLFTGASEMQYSAHPRLVLEMAFIKAVQAGEVTPAATLLARLDDLVRKGGGGNFAPTGPAEPAVTVTARPVPSSAKAIPVPGAERGADAAPVAGEEKAVAPIKEAEKDKEIAVAPHAEKAGPEEMKKSGLAIHPRARDVRRNWDEFLAYVKERKPWMAQVLRLCENPREEGTELLIRFENPSDCTLLQKTENVKDLTEYALDFFQKDLTLKIGSRGDGSGEAVHDGPKEERRALANDPLVQMTLDVFGGQVGAIRTGPRFR